MTPAEIEAYLHRHIPLAAAMGVRVIEGGPDTFVLEAPLGPNINHRETAFGGSVGALAMLAGWSHVHFRLRSEGLDGSTVIQRSSIDFVAPANGPFRASCTGADSAAWRRLRRSVERYGKGRIHVDSVVQSAGHVVAQFQGAYVVLPR